MDNTTSQTISDFIRFLSQSVNDYSFSREEVGRLDLLSSDYLHKLELQSDSYHDRAKIALSLRQCRIDRRTHKDRVAILEPLIQCLETERGKLIFSQLQQVLGAVRKEERATCDRCYVPRVLSQEEYNT